MFIQPTNVTEFGQSSQKFEDRPMALKLGSIVERQSYVLTSTNADGSLALVPVP